MRVGSKSYVCVDADAETITLKDEQNNILRVDPQAATAGPRSHWAAQEPEQFRTVAFTLGVGDYAYRPLSPKDSPPTDRAKGVLCVVSSYDGDNVEVRDAWTGLTSTCLPNDLVKPPLTIRKGLNYILFEIFRKRATKGLKRRTSASGKTTRREKSSAGPTTSTCRSSTPACWEGTGRRPRPQGW